MNNPIELFDEALRHENEEKLAMPHHGKFRASMLGRCYRAQFWERKGVPFSNPLPISVLRTFKIGKLIHEAIEINLDKHRVEQEFEFEHIVFHPDYFDDNCVYDFKSINIWGFKKMKREDYNVEVDKESYCYQVMTEAVYLACDYGELIFFCKDSGETNYDIGKTFRLKTDDWQDRVLVEMDRLKDYWAKGYVPPALPRAFGGKECNYCGWKTMCNEMELEGR